MCIPNIMTIAQATIEEQNVQMLNTLNETEYEGEWLQIHELNDGGHFVV